MRSMRSWQAQEDAAVRFFQPFLTRFPVKAEMIKTTIDPRIEEVEKAVRAKSSTKFVAAFSTGAEPAAAIAANGAGKLPYAFSVQSRLRSTNQNFAPGNRMRAGAHLTEQHGFRRAIR